LALKGVLASEHIRQQAQAEAEELGLPDYEEEILRTMAKRGRQPNISFFAFTATPKFKTLKVFGQPGADGKPEPFHLYSMRRHITGSSSQLRMTPRLIKEKRPGHWPGL